MRDTLIDLQRAIVEAPLQGEIVVGGAAGSGKTTAAIHRAAYLCEEKTSGISQGRICAEWFCYADTQNEE